MIVAQQSAMALKQRSGRLVWLFSGLVAVLAATVLLTSGSGSTARFALGLAIFVTAMLVGALLGFLFSIPRVLSRPTPAADAGDAPGDRILQSNTNLERVSDWLTTILLGVALADLSRLNEGLLRFRRSIAEVAPACAAAQQCSTLPMLAPLLLIAGAALGFLGMYLLMRLSIVGLIYNADQALDAPVARAVYNVAHRSSQLEGETEPTALLADTLRPGPVTVDNALDVMLAQLYQTRTSGYQRVIDLAGWVSGTPLVKRADFWLYLACAWGQKHEVLMKEGDAEGQASARDNALDAARRAIEIDPAYQARMAALTNPDSGNDDLASLRDDPEMRALLGL